MTDETTSTSPSKIKMTEARQMLLEANKKFEEYVSEQEDMVQTLTDEKDKEINELKLAIKEKEEKHQKEIDELRREFEKYKEEQQARLQEATKEKEKMKVEIEDQTFILEHYKRETDNFIEQLNEASKKEQKYLETIRDYNQLRKGKTC